MQLDRRARVYAHWMLDEPIAGAQFEVTFDGSVWYPMAVVGTDVSVLVAGPDTQDNPQDTIVLGLGRNTATARVADSPEIVVQGIGSITVV